MFKVKISTKDLFKKYDKDFVKKVPWDEVAQSFRNYVVDETMRTSKKNPSGMNRFPKLEESTIKYRKRIAKRNSTHPAFAPTRSNLTLSGALLDAIKPLSQRLVSKGRAIIGYQVDPRMKHPGYKGHKRKDKPLMVDIWDRLINLNEDYNIFRGINPDPKSYLISRILKPIIRRKSK